MYEALRSTAKRCKNAECRRAAAARAKSYRLRVKPDIGSDEARRRQRVGLDKKYAYRQRGEARDELQKLGIVPTEWRVRRGWRANWCPTEAA
jgi:hypothetical protein